MIEMRFIGPPTATVIKKEDKEAKLEAFIDDHIASKKQNDEAPGQAYLLIVRSHESPVVRALARIAKRTRHGEFTIKALVMMPGQDANTDWPAELASITSFRSVPDMRLLDAHEQLWLDSNTAWVGDCMRRDPSLRDAYECYASGCKTTAGFVGSAFEQLWNKGQDAKLQPVESCVPDQEIDAHLAGTQSDGRAAPNASTRH